MSRSNRRHVQRRRKGFQCRLEALEPRLFLSLEPAGLDPLFHADPALDSLVADDPGLAGTLAAEGTAGELSGAYPLSAIPALSSLPGARVSLYLDFNGDYQSQWGSFSNITTPAYDQDGDRTTLSDAELASIQKIWEYVAEDYSPFQVNVTTVDPGSYANGVAVQVVIGGNGSWTGGTYGGVAYVGSFTSSSPNTVFIFEDNLGNGAAKYTGDASSHESGHAFGLRHQSLYDGAGTKTQEYYTGPGGGRAPIMGNSYSATRGLWWYGTSTSASTYQDDMAILAGATNGFGYRPDDHGNTVSTATALAVSGSQVSGSGIIATTADADWFSFRTDAGQVSLSASVPASVNDLDARLELRDALGNLVASAAPTTSFGATITAAVSAGSYRLVVASNGGYGDVGQYTVTGTIVAPAGLVNAPTGLAATAVSTTQVNLTWVDNADNETGYAVSRSTNGDNWAEIAANLPANTAAYTDSSAAAGTTYYYQVRAYSASATSDWSNQATATTLPLAPDAPSGLAATAVSSSRIDLAWSDVSGEDGYRIERLTDGQYWSEIATTGTNVTSYQNTGLAASTTYQYRVQAVNAGGSSPYSNTASAATPAVPAVPAAPSNLTVTVVSANQINLAWKDNSDNESGFLVERSSNRGRSWSQIARTAADVTAYSDTAVSPRKTYSYRVRAFNDGGTSALSNVALATTPRLVKAAPAKGLAVRAVSAAQVDLAWRDNSTNEDGFIVERSSNGGRSWVRIARTGAGATSYSDTSLAAGKAYRYRVRAFNGAGISAASNVASVSTPAAVLAAGEAYSGSTTARSLARLDAMFANLAWLDSVLHRWG